MDYVTTPLLFCQQSLWQKKFMELYGNNTCLLLTGRNVQNNQILYSSFFIVVKTNVNCVIIGSFICLSEKAESIAEALEVFKEWNQNWNPTYFVTGYSEAEMNAIESVFPYCRSYICGFHREQAWVRWTGKKGNIEFSSLEDVGQCFAVFCTWRMKKNIWKS